MITARGVDNMVKTVEKQNEINKVVLNEDIKQFPQVHPITDDMHITHDGVSRLVMLDRYALKDTEKKTLKQGYFIVLTIKQDPILLSRRFDIIREIDWNKNEAKIEAEDEVLSVLDDENEAETGIIKRNLSTIDKPLEVYYE